MIWEGKGKSVIFIKAFKPFHCLVTTFQNIKYWWKCWKWLLSSVQGSHLQCQMVQGKGSFTKKSKSWQLLSFSGQCGDLEILTQWQTHADKELPHGRHRYPEQYQVNRELSVPIIGQKVNKTRNKNIRHLFGCWQQLRWSARLWISPIDCGQTLRLTKY